MVDNKVSALVDAVDALIREVPPRITHNVNANVVLTDNVLKDFLDPKKITIRTTRKKKIPKLELSKDAPTFLITILNKV
jgi:hypothetical protein